MQQFDLFQSAHVERPGAEFVEAALNSSSVFILPCGRLKAAAATEARSLYVSDTFRALRRLMDDLGTAYQIASARHGLLHPGSITEPYDLDLATLPSNSRAQWGKHIVNELTSQNTKQVVLLSKGVYAESIIDANASLPIPLKLISPLFGLSHIHEVEWLREANNLGARIRDLRLLYETINRARSRGKTFRLRELSDRPIPQRGVYLFLDKTEKNMLDNGPRIVRIGTHAISQGSKSTLRSRLRNHLGPAHGTGSHRGSVFRLHVGRAMLETEAAGINALPTWGIGQQASKEILKAESIHEQKVTDYIGELEVFLIDADDKPSKDSLRAAIETQLIGLMTSAFLPIDLASTQWLGNFSPNESIAKTKLWNIRDVGRPYWPEKLGTMRELFRERFE